MIKQAQELQQKMADAQQKVETLEAEGVAGGGIVKVTINGKNNATSINIDDSVIDKNEKEIGITAIRGITRKKSTITQIAR